MRVGFGCLEVLFGLGCGGRRIADGYCINTTIASPHDRSGAPGYHKPVIINGTSELGNTHGGYHPTSCTISQNSPNPQVGDLPGRAKLQVTVIASDNQSQPMFSLHSQRCRPHHHIQVPCGNKISSRQSSASRKRNA